MLLCDSQTPDVSLEPMAALCKMPRFMLRLRLVLLENCMLDILP
jgi:hypothetical protein